MHVHACMRMRLDVGPPSPCLFAFSVSGVAANAKVGSELIRVEAIDNDIGNNSIVHYYIYGYHYTNLQTNDTEVMGSIFTIGELPHKARMFGSSMSQCAGVCGLTQHNSHYCYICYILTH